MKRLFLAITKGEEIRFLGHLDYLRTMERVVVRSGIPIAFSEGFNPHMKISLDSALAVGVTADPLYMEIKLEKDMPIEEAYAARDAKGHDHLPHRRSGTGMAEIRSFFQ